MILLGRSRPVPLSRSPPSRLAGAHPPGSTHARQVQSKVHDILVAIDAAAYTNPDSDRPAAASAAAAAFRRLRVGGAALAALHQPQPPGADYGPRLSSIAAPACVEPEPAAPCSGDGRPRPLAQTTTDGHAAAIPASSLTSLSTPLPPTPSPVLRPVAHTRNGTLAELTLQIPAGPEAAPEAARRPGFSSRGP